MNSPEIKAVIFDCDGTLVDSEPITNEVLVEFAGEFGLVLDHAETHALFVGRDMAEIITVLESRLDSKLPDDFTFQFRALQATALEQRLQPIDGALELMQRVRLPSYLASNAPRDKIGINLRVTGLNQFFPDDRVFSAYDINVWKPNPDLFLHVAERAGFQPGEIAVVEDSQAGVEAAIRAGMQVFCYSPNSTIPQPMAHDSISSESESRYKTVRVVSQLMQLAEHFE